MQQHLQCRAEGQRLSVECRRALLYGSEPRAHTAENMGGCCRMSPTYASFAFSRSSSAHAPEAGYQASVIHWLSQLEPHLHGFVAMPNMLWLTTCKDEDKLG